MAIAGKHQIGYRKPKGSKIRHLPYPGRFKFEEADYSIKKKFGTDAWVLNIGSVLEQIVQEHNAEATDDSTLIHLHDLKVLNFKKGVFQWSRHTLNLEMHYTVMRNGQKQTSGAVQGKGSGSGAEFGFATYIPVVGNANFDRGIEIAMFRALEQCLFALSEAVGKS